MIYLQLFLSFITIGLFSIGGGLAAMPLLQAEIVTKHNWLTLSEFTDLVTLAEMTPGPIAINSATFAGMKVAGIAGALLASVSVILPSCFIVSFLSYIYHKYKGVSTLQSVLASLRPTVVALIASAGLNILMLVLFGGKKFAVESTQWLNGFIFIGAFVLLRKTKISPILVMVLSGVVSLSVNIILSLF